jgi:putative ABC transport system permease protein
MVAAQLNPMSLLSVSGVMALLLTLLLLAVIAGGYPAFILSRLSPVLALRGQLGRELSGTGLRAGLVLAQFVISIALLISAGIVNKQLDFALDKSLGFDPNNVMVVELGPSQARQAYELMRSELLGQASIESVSAGSIVPTRSLSDGATFNHAEESGLSSLTTRRISVSDDYFQTLGMELLSGRALDSSRPGDFMPAIGPDNLEVSGGVIFNEAAARQAGWSDPEQAIGQALFSEFSFGGLNFRMNFTVVGVVADAHYGSVRNEIAPISYALDNNRRYMIIRARPGAMMQATEAAERVWQQAVPDYPVRRLNMEAEYSALYAGENRTFILFMGLASMAIIMSCFGLYGLASLIAETRRKEISIRKVLGASVQQLMIMLSWSICRLVLLANIIAWPAAFWIMQNWLNNFAYRTAMDISIFIFATLTTLTIALLTVMHRTWAAASISPVAALRAE